MQLQAREISLKLIASIRAPGQVTFILDDSWLLFANYVVYISKYFKKEP
jgi:hypothetical protein